MLSTIFMLVLQGLRIRSAYIFAGITCFMISGVLVKGVWGYLIPVGLLVMGTVEAVTSVCLGFPSKILQKNILLTVCLCRRSTSSLP